MLTIENHNCDGASFLYADMHAKFEKVRDYSDLRWKLHGKTDFVFPSYKYHRLPITEICIFATLSLLSFAAVFVRF
jgi:hypothetical protein